MKSFFKSPLAYILAGLFSLTMGWIFFNLLYSFVENIQALPQGTQGGELQFVNHVVIKLFGNLNFILLMICPILTMKLFSEEKKDQSIDLYFSSPLSDWQLVAGKFLAAFCMGVFILSTTLIFPLILWMIGIQDYSFVFSGYGGLLLNLASYLAIGLFASSLTKSQVVAALLSFVIIMGFWLISWVIQLSSDYFLVEILKQATMASHYESFVKGIVGSHSLVYYATFTGFWLYLTKKSLEARTW
ncbi:MAG: ABC transporter permease subunit [Bacteriovoracaceae bacterium]